MRCRGQHLLLLGVIGMIGCSPDSPQAPEVTTGTQPLRVVAIGNSITAGFMNDGLVLDGQLASYANLISRQAGAGDLEMPFVDRPGAGAGAGRSPLFVNEAGEVTTDEISDPLSLLLNAAYPVPYDNLAVPGANTKDILDAWNFATSEDNNLLFDIVLRNSVLPPGRRTVLDQAAALSPQVLLLWIGSNDFLGGATGGEPEVGGNVTELTVWEEQFLRIMDAVEGMNAPMVAVANMPDVTVIPYVTHLFLGETVDSAFVRWNMEEDLDGDGDDVAFVLLKAPVADPERAADYLPGPDGASRDTLSRRNTLTTAEVALLRSTAGAFNEVIARETRARGFAHVDIGSRLLELPRDRTSTDDFAVLNAIYPWLPDPATGVLFQNEKSAFSLDGVHPSEKGHATIANAFIDALNERYGLEIPLVDTESVRNVTGFDRAGPGGGLTRRSHRGPP